MGLDPDADSECPSYGRQMALKRGFLFIFFLNTAQIIVLGRQLLIDVLKACGSLKEEIQLLINTIHRKGLNECCIPSHVNLLSSVMTLWIYGFVQSELVALLLVVSFSSQRMLWITYTGCIFFL